MDYMYRRYLHPIQHLFLDQLSVQCPYPFLAEIGVAEASVEVLLREENVFPIVLLVGNVILVQQDAGFYRYTFRGKLG